MISLNKVRRLLHTISELGLHTEPLLNIGESDELIAEFWCNDKYLSIEISSEGLDISGMHNGVHTESCLEKGWLYETS